MCGIAGIINKNNFDSSEKLKKILKKIKYRGPDESGIKRFRNITIGMNRLSIIDSKKCKKAVKKSEKLIQKQGRMLVRKSGTEPKIRIMGESNNILLLKRCIDIVKRSLN